MLQWRFSNGENCIASLRLVNVRAFVKLFMLSVRTPGGLFLGDTVHRGCRFSAFSYGTTANH